MGSSTVVQLQPYIDSHRLAHETIDNAKHLIISHAISVRKNCTDKLGYSPSRTNDEVQNSISVFTSIHLSHVGIEASDDLIKVMKRKFFGEL